MIRTHKRGRKRIKDLTSRLCLNLRDVMYLYVVAGNVFFHFLSSFVPHATADTADTCEVERPHLTWMISGARYSGVPHRVQVLWSKNQPTSSAISLPVRIPSTRRSVICVLSKTLLMTKLDRAFREFNRHYSLREYFYSIIMVLEDVRWIPYYPVRSSYPIEVHGNLIIVLKSANEPSNLVSDHGFNSLNGNKMATSGPVLYTIEFYHPHQDRRGVPFRTFHIVPGLPGWNLCSNNHFLPPQRHVKS